MKFAALLAIFSAVALADDPSWTGFGRISCYGHFDTDVSFGEGSTNGGPGEVTCSPVEWGGVLSPEAFFITEDSTGEVTEVWAWDYHEPNIPYASCNGQMWYKMDDLDTGVCGASKGYHGCGYAACYGEISCYGC